MLREKMGYGGIIVSDDMEMGAIAAHHGISEASIAAVRAGIDLIIVSNYRRDDPELPERLVRAIGAEAVRDPQLRAMIEASSARIATLKRGRLMRDAVPAS